MVDRHDKDYNDVQDVDLDKTDAHPQHQADVKLLNIQHRKPKYEQVPVPLDGGYGWVIVVSVAYCLFCATR